MRNNSVQKNEMSHLECVTHLNNNYVCFREKDVSFFSVKKGKFNDSSFFIEFDKKKVKWFSKKKFRYNFNFSIIRCLMIISQLYYFKCLQYKTRDNMESIYNVRSSHTSCTTEFIVIDLKMICCTERVQHLNNCNLNNIHWTLVLIVCVISLRHRYVL